MSASIEFVMQRQTQQVVPVNEVPISIFKWNDDDWQFLLPYEREGYREPMDTCGACRSICSWHNETCNIWSHLITIVVLIVLAIAYMPSDTTSTYIYRYWFFMVGCIICMSASSLYHILQSHQNKAFVLFMQRIDHVGIVAFFLCYAVGVWLDNPAPSGVDTRIYGYTTIACGLITIPVVLYCNPETQRGLRLACYTATSVCFSVQVILELVWRSEHDAPNVWRESIIYWVFTALLMAIGFFCYTTYFPERGCTHIFYCNRTRCGVQCSVHQQTTNGHCSSQRLDVCGSSHQVWHVCVSFAIFLQFANLVLLRPL